MDLVVISCEQFAALLFIFTVYFGAVILHIFLYCVRLVFGALLLMFTELLYILRDWSRATG